MANEFIELNVIPNGEKPVFHAAQYDVGRPIIIKLKKGEDDFTPTGLTLELQVRKVDNNIVTAASSSVDGNIVTFLTTEQMTACSGTNLCEVQLSDASTTIATLHFFLVVQRDVLNGGLSSASEIHDLEEQIAEIVPEVIGDDYYDKTEVDALIAEHAFDPTNYYDKQETDQAIQDAISEVPIFDPTNYYDKAATNALLADKANTSDLATVATTGDYDDLLNKPTLPDMSNYYTKSETYNKTEIDNALATKQDKIETKTASGSLITITDGGDNIPMKSLVSQIVAVESGSGTKSPTNPYTISGFSQADISVCGKNLFDGVYPSIDDNIKYRQIRVPNGTYTMSSNCPLDSSNFANVFFINGYATSGASTSLTGVYQGVTITVTTTDNYITVAYRSNNGVNPENYLSQIEIGSTATTYEAYNGNTYTFTFGQTVYGGYFDNKGNLVVTHGYIASYNGETINEPWISSIDEYVPNTSPSTGAQVVYPLTTPITLSITSQDIPTLSGDNNIFSNCGDLDIEYYTSSADDIAALIRVMTGG